MLEIRHDLCYLREIGRRLGTLRQIFADVLRQEVFQRLRYCELLVGSFPMCSTTDLAQQVVNVTMVLRNTFEELIEVLYKAANLDAPC